MKPKNIEEAHAELTSKGEEIGPIHQYPWGHFAEFKDPDGNG